LVRAEQMGNEPPRTPQRDELAVQPTIGYSVLEDLLEHLGGHLEFVPLSQDDIAYVAHLPFAMSSESSGRMAIAVPQEAGVILLVEDEPQVQAVTTRILRAFGYAVIAAHNERTALAHAEQYGAAISLIVSDLVLPGVSGKELVRRLHRPCEQARVLYISGYSPEHVGALPAGECFLRKPFTAQELLAAVRELMPEAAF
jgi:CheY-like chemotaxis protein